MYRLFRAGRIKIYKRVVQIAMIVIITSPFDRIHENAAQVVKIADDMHNAICKRKQKKGKGFIFSFSW